MCRLVSKRIQQRLLSELDLSLKKAFKIAQSIETAHKETHEMRASGSQVASHQTGEGHFKTILYSLWERGYHHPDKCFFKEQECRAYGKMSHS